ncbi:hypothetical protein DFH08DRAFT_801579 [Mycena albidolilacea]|uniref:Uncharacterized protein n=1 Tax=Mycena albidolilacea TaxID=1033008 RepID=A0AAD7AJC9_9AGAR|nr:hypothetical protein DFH08DRAFT_801579 [Mycena albidolilacea]
MSAAVLQWAICVCSVTVSVSLRNARTTLSVSNQARWCTGYIWNDGQGLGSSSVDSRNRAAPGIIPSWFSTLVEYSHQLSCFSPWTAGIPWGQGLPLRHVPRPMWGYDTVGWCSTARQTAVDGSWEVQGHEERRKGHEADKGERLKEVEDAAKAVDTRSTPALRAGGDGPGPAAGTMGEEGPQCEDGHLLGPRVERVRGGQIHRWVHGVVSQERSCAWRSVVKRKESWLARQDRRTWAGFQKFVVGRYNGESNAHNQLKTLYANYEPYG